MRFDISSSMDILKCCARYLRRARQTTVVTAKANFPGIVGSELRIALQVSRKCVVL